MSDQPGFGKIVRNNLLLVVAGAVVFGLLARLTNPAFAFLFMLGYLILALINVVLGFSHIGRGAAAYFVSALLVLLIGFGSCTGMFALLGSGPGI